MKFKVGDPVGTKPYLCVGGPLDGGTRVGMGIATCGYHRERLTLLGSEFDVLAHDTIYDNLGPDFKSESILLVHIFDGFYTYSKCGYPKWGPGEIYDYGDAEREDVPFITGPANGRRYVIPSHEDRINIPVYKSGLKWYEEDDLISGREFDVATYELRRIGFTIGYTTGRFGKPPLPVRVVRNCWVLKGSTCAEIASAIISGYRKTL